MNFEGAKQEGGPSMNSALQSWESCRVDGSQVIIGNGEAEAIFELDPKGNLIHYVGFGEVPPAILDRWRIEAKSRFDDFKIAAE